MTRERRVETHVLELENRMKHIKKNRKPANRQPMIESLEGRALYSATPAGHAPPPPPPPGGGTTTVAIIAILIG